MACEFGEKVVESLNDCLSVVFAGLDADLTVSAELVNAVKDEVLAPGASGFLHQSLDFDSSSEFQVPQFINDTVVKVFSFFAFDDSRHNVLERS